MLNELVSNIAVVIKDKDIQSIAAEGAENMLVGLTTGDFTAIPTVATDVGKIVLSVPNIIFADKMYHFLTKAFRNYDDQVKFATRFEKDSRTYKDSVKKIVQIVDKIDFDEKIDWLANLTRAVFLEYIGVEEYLRLSTAISMLTVDDLIALKYYYGRKDEKENSTLSNYYTYRLVTKITPTTYGTLTSKYTLSASGVKLLKYGVDFENCENYKVPINAQGGDKQ